MLAVVAAGALVLPTALAVSAALVLLAAGVYDAVSVRRAPGVDRRLPRVLSRGVRARLEATPTEPLTGRLRLRQPALPDLGVEPSEADGHLDVSLLPRRRGRHRLPALAARREGALGLGRWFHTVGEEREVLVYPDLPAATRVALAVRQGRFGDAGRLRRGPLGLGTEFESIREYLPDDDVRQVNWRATARLGRPMSNQYRVEQDREIVCLIDAGRLMAAPVGDRTRLDAAVDAATTVALSADELGDRCGLVAFDDEVRRRLAPGRAAGQTVVRALFDLEPRSVDSDYELAFRAVGNAKRAWVLVLTDLLDESAAGTLLEAMPVLARRHAVAVASVADPELEGMVSTPPERPLDVYAASAALEVLEARSRVAGRLRRLGTQVIEAPPDRLGAACVTALLRAKARARI
ncbi:MAG: DUF58 domain-containing protein [Thermoleophilaceae bacterium]